MIRLLRLSGSILLLTTVALWVGDMADVISGATDEHWWRLTLKAGLVTFAGSYLLGAMRPLARQVSKGHCVVCGRPTQRGHTYCLDHLQETVNATRDEARTRGASRPKTAL